MRNLQERHPEMGLRLPTEAEWEYGARAGSPTTFSFGDDVADLPRFGNCKGKDRHPKLAPVGVYEPNDQGLYDMHGNVSEWTQDWHGEYPKGPVTDPQGPPAGTRKIRRGGSWDIKPENCGAGRRTRGVLDLRSGEVGFRLVREPVSDSSSRR